MLDLGRAQVAEAGQVALLAEARGVEVAEGLGDAHLVGRVEAGLRGHLLALAAQGLAGAGAHAGGGRHRLGSRAGARLGRRRRLGRGGGRGRGDGLGAERRGGVVGPVTPGRPCESVLRAAREFYAAV